MLKLLICDDDVNDLKRVENISRRWCDENDVRADISSFSAADDMIAFLSEHGAADIYILDVLMPSVSGIELGRLIRDIDRNGKIIYLTSTRDYAVDSYEVDAFYYLIKPVSEDKLLPLLARAISQKKKRSDASICVHTREGDVMIPVSSIDYVESSMRFPHYVTEQGHITGLMLRSAFRDEMRRLLSCPGFFLCGSSFVVNLAHIRAIEKTASSSPAEDPYCCREAPYRVSAWHGRTIGWCRVEHADTVDHYGVCARTKVRILEFVPAENGF